MLTRMLMALVLVGRLATSTYSLAADEEHPLSTVEQKKLTDEKATVAKQLAVLGKSDAPASQVATTDNAEREVSKPVSPTDSGKPQIKTQSVGLPESVGRKEALTKRRDELDAQLKKLAGDINHAEFFKDKTPRAFAMSDAPQPADMPVYVRGNPYAPSTVVPRGAVRVASWDKFPAIPAGHSGRMQLANWLARERACCWSSVRVSHVTRFAAAA